MSQRPQFPLALALLFLAPALARAADFLPPPPAPRVEIIEPAGDWSTFINQQLTVRAQRTVKPGDPDGDPVWYDYAGHLASRADFTITWSSHDGDFFEQFTPVAIYEAPSDITGSTSPNAITASPTDLGTDPSPEVFTGRDERIRQLRETLAKDPKASNINLTRFYLAVRLQPQTHIPATPADECVDLLLKITATANAEADYHFEFPNTNASPALVVPRAAVLAASMLRPTDPARSRQLLAIAFQYLDWSYSHRKATWATLQPPVPTSSPFERPRDPARELAAWNKNKKYIADAEYLSSDEHAILDAAIRQYGLSLGLQHPAGVRALLEPLAAKYPNTPIAAAARRQIALAEKLLPAPTTQPLQISLPLSPAEYETRITAWYNGLERTHEDPTLLAEDFLQRLSHYQYVTPGTVHFAIGALRSHENFRQSSAHLTPDHFHYPDTLTFLNQAMAYTEGNPELHAELLQAVGTTLEPETDLQPASDALQQAASLLASPQRALALTRIQCLQEHATLEERMGHTQAARDGHILLLSNDLFYLETDPATLNEMRTLYARSAFSLIQLNRRNLKALKELNLIFSADEHLRPQYDAALKEAQE